MSTQYYAPEQHGSERQDQGQQGQGQGQAPGEQPMWRQVPGQPPAWQQPAWQQPGWQQAPGQYAARRSTPWGAIMAVGAAVVVACTLALVFLLGHSGSTAPGGSTPASTSGSGQHAPVNPAVPTHPVVNPAVPAHPAG